VREEWFHTPYPGLSHDWGVTREHLVFPIMPLTADEARLRAGGAYYQYDPDLPSKWGIMPRDGSAREMRWFDIPGIVMGHVMNAYTEGSKVIIDTPSARATASASSRTSTATCPRCPKRSPRSPASPSTCRSPMPRR
jgi:carotenoid cleavage dioxygenase-like enzyme